MLEDVFGFAEHQQKGTYGWGYKLKLTRYNDNSFLNKANAFNKAKVKFIGFEWYVTHYASSREQQKIISNQFLSKMATEPR